MPDHHPTDWNPRDPEVLADQRRAYDDMRERCPVAHSDAMNWSLFRHEDVHSVLMDPDTFSNASRHPAIPNALNGQEHANHRRVLEPFFSAEQMAEFEPTCRAIAAEAARSLAATGTADAISTFAEPVALKTMCLFLGWPVEAWERVRDWIYGNQRASAERDREAAKALAAEYATMVKEAIGAHRQPSADPEDVTSRLMATEVDGGQWTDDDIVDTLRNWIAGHGTVLEAIGIVVHHLAQDQDLQHRLRDDPELIPAAVDEILRADGPLVSNRRTATRDVTIKDRPIAAGEKLALMWIAANRDPRAFDHPESIRLDRDPEGNLLFGAGIHYCLGAPLARLELRVAIEELLARTTGLSLASDQPPQRDTIPSNGLSDVLVVAS